MKLNKKNNSHAINLLFSSKKELLYQKLQLPEDLRILSIIGAGGKTSVMYQLAKEYASLGKKVLCTTSTHIFIPPADKIPITLFAPVSCQQIKESFCHSPVIVVGVRESSNKLSSVPFSFFQEALKIADLILCEADGSKRLPMKVPALHEPALIPESDAVIIVSGLSALHRPLAEICHRSKLAAELLNCSPSTSLGVQEFARLIYDPQGLMKNLTNQKEKTYIFLNQADTLQNIKDGEEIKKLLFKQGLSHVLIGSLQKEFME